MSELTPELADFGAHGAAEFARTRDFGVEALVFHPGVEDALFELPAIAEFEGGNALFGDVFVEGIGRNAKILRSLPDIHYFACVSHQSLPPCPVES